LHHLPSVGEQRSERRAGRAELARRAEVDGVGEKTPAQLCRVLLDKRKNGNRSVEALVEHMSNDPLVAWGWAPGAQREPVPIAKPEFVALLQRWQTAGAPCPK
jgi:hypothetical protein